MKKLPAKIVLVEIVKAKGSAGRWNGYRVREITERGGFVRVFEAYGRDEARVVARAKAKEHGVGFIFADPHWYTREGFDD